VIGKKQAMPEGNIKKGKTYQKEGTHKELQSAKKSESSSE